MDQYCVFGNPIKQSRSPFIHQSFAQQTRQSLSYVSELAPLDGFKSSVNELIKKGGKGANVTAPFKEQAMEMCDQLSEGAKLAGAVNTLTFKDGKIYGDNTDGVGLVQDLLRHDISLSGAKILLLGAGGAAKGVILPLLEQGISHLTIANRTVSKAKDLVDEFKDIRLDACGFDEVNTIKPDVIINATSASLSGSIPPISSEIIEASTVCYDMVYGKSLSPFLVWARDSGAAQVIDGLGMLVGQAAESFYIWRGVRPEVEQVLTELRKALAED